MNSYDIIGYIYQADIHCPDCIAQTFGGSILDDSEWVLDREASSRGIDRYDEGSFDSDDFPKVVLACMTDQSEYCGTCHAVILEIDDDPDDADD